MIEVIATIILIALVGSLGVPLVMLTLARFGYFPPIAINAFGRVWKFEPRMKFITTRVDDTVMQANTAIVNNSLKTSAAASVFAVVCMPQLARDE